MRVKRRAGGARRASVWLSFYGRLEAEILRKVTTLWSALTCQRFCRARLAERERNYAVGQEAVGQKAVGQKAVGSKRAGTTAGYSFRAVGTGTAGVVGRCD